MAGRSHALCMRAVMALVVRLVLLLLALVVRAVHVNK